VAAILEVSFGICLPSFALSAPSPLVLGPMGAYHKLHSGAVTAWSGFIRVDGTPYTWMGAADDAPQAVDQVEVSYTSTRSTFISNAGGKVALNITFTSPVTPQDLKRQSLTFSYLEVSVQSLDGASHNVELYTDVSAGKTRLACCFLSRTQMADLLL
jgi:hypothetical protein